MEWILSKGLGLLGFLATLCVCNLPLFWIVRRISLFDSKSKKLNVYFTSVLFLFVLFVSMLALNYSYALVKGNRS